MTPNRSFVVLGSICCTTGDAFACFMGRLFPKSQPIREGKTVAGFLGAACFTAIHALAYLILSGYVAQITIFSIVALAAAAFVIGGLADLLPAKEIGMDDNFTTIFYGTMMWWAYLSVMPTLVTFAQ